MDPLRYDTVPAILVHPNGKLISTTDPLAVNATVTVGTVNASEVITTAPVTRTITLTETPVALNSKSNLRQITIKNLDPSITAKIGETGMTPANAKGLTLDPGAIYQEGFDPATAVTIYGRSTGAAIEVEVYEA